MLIFEVQLGLVGLLVILTFRKLKPLNLVLNLLDFGWTRGGMGFMTSTYFMQMEALQLQQ